MQWEMQLLLAAVVIIAAALAARLVFEREDRIRDQDIPRTCERCGARFAGEAMIYCPTATVACSHAIWAEPGVRATGEDWHLRHQQQEPSA